MLLRPALLAVAATLLLVACDGEKITYDSTRYDIDWTLLAGGADSGVPGVYGSLGVPAAGNLPGGRSGAVSWRELDTETGDEVFWLFGGTGYDANGDLGPLNDLWKYGDHDGELQWTWVAGSATVAGSTAVYGTLGEAAAGNVPGGRGQAVAWVDDDGSLMLFGGAGLDANAASDRLNDLWRYSIAGNTWTWLGGSDTVNQPGVYGVQGTADPGNRPGARYAGAGWVDDDGNFWLFGGNGYDADAGCCWLNDLWKFDGTAWTWIKGSDSANADAVYGSTGTAGGANIPGGRYGAVAWHTADGNEEDDIDARAGWLFGGTGNNDEGDRVVFNELWKYDYESGDWIFMTGTKGNYSAGSYGGRGLFATTNAPPSRHRPTAWQTDGTLWLFGGTVEATEGVETAPNDLWRFDSIAWTWVGGANFDNPDGEYPDALLEIGQPGGREGGVGWVDDLDNLWLFGGDGRNDLWIF